MIKPNAVQKGSAMVETAILMVVLIPVIFGTVMVGKLIDLKQTSEQAGRYAAWEATVYPQSGPDGLKPAAVRERFFGAADNAISSTRREAGSNTLWGAEDATQNPGWADRSGIEIDESSVAGLAYERGVGDASVAMRVGRAAGGSGEILDGLKGNSWGLTTNGLVRAGVSVPVKTNEWLQAGAQTCGSESGYVCLQSKSVILVDGWSASSDEQAKRRVRSLVPASALQPLGDLIANVGHLPMFKELKKLDGAFGHVDMSVLPDYAK